MYQLKKYHEIKKKTLYHTYLWIQIFFDFYLIFYECMGHEVEERNICKLSKESNASNSIMSLSIYQILHIFWQIIVLFIE